MTGYSVEAFHGVIADQLAKFIFRTMAMVHHNLTPHSELTKYAQSLEIPHHMLIYSPSREVLL